MVFFSVLLCGPAGAGWVVWMDESNADCVRRKTPRKIKKFKRHESMEGFSEAMYAIVAVFFLAAHRASVAVAFMTEECGTVYAM